MARMPNVEYQTTRKGQGNKEASGFAESAFNSISSALWMLAYMLVFLIEMVLTAMSLITSLVSLILGVLAAIAGAIAGVAAKIAGMCSDLKDEVKAAWVNWKDKKERIAARAKQLEALEA